MITLAMLMEKQGAVPSRERGGAVTQWDSHLTSGRCVEEVVEMVVVYN